MASQVENEITEVTRREIMDFFETGEVHWSGRMPEDQFLMRLYDLAKLPSTDFRYSTAAQDIRTHCVQFSDWEICWVFTDERLNLLRADDDEFLRFLCETVHPAVQAEQEDANFLVAAYNRALRADGWLLVERATMISDRTKYRPTRTTDRAHIYEEPTGWEKVEAQVQKMQSDLVRSQSEEEWQTVGLLGRETLISLAQEVYDPEIHAATDGTAASKTDARRMLERYFSAELAGGPNEEARSHAKAALKLALALQHKRTATFKMAALNSESTISVVNLVAILSGRRGTIS